MGLRLQNGKYCSMGAAGLCVVSCPLGGCVSRPTRPQETDRERDRLDRERGAGTQEARSFGDRQG